MAVAYVVFFGDFALLPPVQCGQGLVEQIEETREMFSPLLFEIADEPFRNISALHLCTGFIT